MNHNNLRIAFYLWLAQFFVAICCAFFDWHHLAIWDGKWYGHIVDFGYQSVLSPDPDKKFGNVGFFPGYPVFASLWKMIFQVSTDAALLIGSSIASLLTWFYFAEYLDVRGDSKKLGNLLWMWVWPFSFLFVCGYSESTNAATVMGFVLFSEKWILSLSESKPEAPRKSWMWFALACFHGYAMTATRLLSVLFVFYPFLRALQLRPTITTLSKSFLIALVSVMGMISFFVFCHYEFGAWNFYYISEERVWATYVDWGKLFPPYELFDFERPLRADTLGKYLTIAFGFYFCYLTYDITKNKKFRSQIAALYLVCGMFWGAYLIGRTSWQFKGMGRMLIPIMLLLMPDFKLPDCTSIKGFPAVKRAAWGFLWMILFILQVVYAAKFARNGWVA
ncbi:MAG: hypothetical protein JST80_01200 [Bdellovibrionales bacterium]|nr:hypothetical protein [Bdellovibrionales bacterium]